ncbi:hypothetical protein HD597_000511 [Nonomuraea thailandensis]|uniref:Uncharacterized protein n=1 Tax=Nonomuraea thailandensis TaxID=1188745 RepID=A0A9X2GDT3_9ACTN|nr:hypothetical protein [Nonomuraea thailandensis]
MCRHTLDDTTCEVIVDAFGDDSLRTVLAAVI